MNFINYFNKIIKPATTLIHSSADVERGNSIPGRIITEDKASTSVEMLNARLKVSDALILYQINLSYSCHKKALDF